MRRYAILAAVFSVLIVAATPAAAEFRLERSLALDAGGTFTLNSETGSVTLVGDSTSGVVVTVTSSDDNLADRLDIRFATAPGRATVTAMRRGSRFDRLFGDWFQGHVQFVVHVPRSAIVDLGTSGGSIHAAGVAGPARVHTSGGSVTVEDVAHDVDASTSGGSIHVEHVGGSAGAHTSGGSIEVTDVRGDVRVDTSGGSVTVRDAGGRVDAHTSGGRVAAAFARGNNHGGDLSTSGGSVRAEVDAGVALSIDASTSGGEVVSDVPVTVRGSTSKSILRGDLNGGGSTLRLHSSGGGIRIAAAASSTASR